MSVFINIGTVLVGIALIVIIIRLMVRKKMTEAQSILWLIIGFMTIITGMFPPIIPYIAQKLGVWYPPAILFLVAFIGLLLIVFKNTIELSIQSNKIYELSMQIALLNTENKMLKEKLDKGEEFYQSINL